MAELRQFTLTFSDEIDQMTMNDITGTIDHLIYDQFPEVNLKDGLITPRYECKECGDEITKEEHTNQDERCNDCQQDYLTDETYI